VYIEERAMEHPAASYILSKLKNKTIIPVKHYKDVFSPRQDFYIQKNSPKLILAVKSGNFFYPGSQMCLNYGYDDFYYTTQIMNCLYNCDYCYLQGLYTSANIVAFVNIKDTFREIKKFFYGRKPLLCVSYDADILALENITGFVREWIRFASENKNITLEIRTKSANFDSVADMEPLCNVILAWTLSPEIYIKEYEKGAPGLAARLKSIDSAVRAGWKVRLCFDPLIYGPGCADIYKNFIRNVFIKIPSDKILDICAGPFRAPRNLLKIMEKQNPSIIYSYPFDLNKNVCTYAEEHVNELYGAVSSQLPDLPAYFYKT